MDEEIEESFMEDSSDEYDREQLEIALYSQIHFAQDDETRHTKSEHNVYNIEGGAFENDFNINVEGNEKVGFIAIESNSDYILNDNLRKKYGNLNILDDTRRKEYDDIEKNSNENLGTTNFRKRIHVPLKQGHKKSQDNLISSEHGKNSTKEKTLIENKKGSEGDGKVFTAEELFLGTNSEDDVDDNMIDDSDDDDEVICVSDSSDIILSDSEADSLDIVLGEPEERVDDIQMNVRSNSRYTYRKMSNEDTLPDEEKHGDDENNWAICREDSYRDLTSATGRPGRYYKPIKCHNCDKEGHLSKNCPQPKKVIVCILCAEPGHISRACPQAMCFNCKEPGHDSKSCTFPRRSLSYICYRCNMPGHDQTRCPDTWRQFHISITTGKIRRYTYDARKRTPTCFNCGMEGHFGHECEEDRMNGCPTVYTPFICKYQNMKEFKEIIRNAEKEDEDRPLKRSRSEEFLSKQDRGMKKSKPSHHIRFDEEKARGHNDNFNKDWKKTSKFAHIAKKRPENRTGRNNFDKMQFTILNTRKDGKSKETEGMTGEKIKNKSWNKKQPGKEKAEGVYKKNERKITLNTSNCNFTISSKSDFNKDFDFSERNKNGLHKKGRVQQNAEKVGQKRKFNSKFETDVIDLTISNDIDLRTRKEKKWEKNHGKFSNLRNDGLRSDDLFSMQKIVKLQSSGQFDMPIEVEGDIEHQVHNNEWWRKRKNRKARK